MSARISRNAVTDQLLEDFIWKRYYDKSVAWLRTSISEDIISFNIGADTKIRKFVVGGNIGYNILDFGILSGYTLNLGIYGTYDLNDVVRMYANANLAMHSVTESINSAIIGTSVSDLSTSDTTLDVGILHKIFAPYLTGRGYMTLGYQSGYKFTQKYKGMDFMDISADSQMFLAPGYELALGKDIWFSVGTFMRPSLRFGIEYDLLGGGAQNLQFKFSEVARWRNWETGDSVPLWLRYGAQIDFSFIVGTNLSVGYEILKNGDFTANQIKLNGTYRF